MTDQDKKLLEDPQELSREEWLKRCAARLREIGALDEPLADEMAKTVLEDSGYSLTDSPEHAADDEMSYWTE